MELVNQFVVKQPIDQTWATLTDVEKIAPCLPGAQLQEIEGDTYRGVVKVKVGPIQANFKGEAQFVEKDDANHRAVLNAAGKDTGNKGNASAVITAQLEAVDPTTTKCVVSTDLKITGKFAQFGRGAMQDISSKLLGEFVTNLETLTADTHHQHHHAAEHAAAAANGAATETTASASTGAASPAPAADPAAKRSIQAPEAKPLDLGSVAGPALAKRALPVVLGLLVVLFLLRRRGRRRA
jgi:uncharacterized protein